MDYKKAAKPLSKYWKVEKKHETSYTGGQVEYVASTNVLACLCNGNVSFLSLETGEVTFMLVDENAPEYAEEIMCFAIHPQGKEIITASRNQLLRVWNIKSKTMMKTWKAHDAPIAKMVFDSTGKLLMTGSADHTAKVWDIERGYCTHNFRHSFGIVNQVAFSKTSNPLYAMTCCDDHIIKVWNLRENKENQLVAELKGHLNAVTSLCVCDGGLLLSASRDKTVIIWDIFTGQQLKTAVIYESIESIQLISPSFYPSLGITSSISATKPKGKKPIKQTTSEFYVVIAGEFGVPAIYRASCVIDGSLVSYQFDEVMKAKKDNEIIFYKNEMEHSKERNVSYYASLFMLKSVLICESSFTLIGITNSNNFKIYASKDCSLFYTHTVIGNNDEIVDLAYCGDSNNLAVATNSYELRLLFIPTFSARLLYGHHDTILSVKCSLDGRFAVTTSKDKTVRMWHLPSRMCLVTCEGHFQDVSCVGLSQRPQVISKQLMMMIYRDALQSDYNHSYERSQYDDVITDLMTEVNSLSIPSFWISGSEDKTIKLWDLSSVSKSIIHGAKVTVKAHDKSINAITVSPNDQLVATCSMDKTIKIWSLPSLTSVMVLTGHRKGVWDISFSSLNSVLLSSSGDQTIRVWNIKDGSTMYTIEGFDHSVLIH